MKDDFKFDTFEEYYASDVVWDDGEAERNRTPEDRAADWYGEICYEEMRDGKLVFVNVLHDLLEPFKTEVIDALGGELTLTQRQAIEKALSRAFGSGCITEKRQDRRGRGLNAHTKSRSRKAIDKIELLYSEWVRLDQPAYKDLGEHMQQEHGITFKVSTIGHYIRRRLKQQDEK